MSKSYTHEELMQILTLHGQWLRDEPGGVRANLDGANLDGANLCGANLYGANLDGANLDGANLCGANLVRANLYGANLDGANLYGANLDGANLCGANLVRANLDGANLDGANLDGANLYGANLCGAKIGTRPLLRAPIQIFGSRYPVIEMLDNTIRIGCAVNVTSELLSSLFIKHNTPEPMRPLYIEAVKLIEEYAEKYPLLGEAQI